MTNDDMQAIELLRGLSLQVDCLEAHDFLHDAIYHIQERDTPNNGSIYTYFRDGR